VLERAVRVGAVGIVLAICFVHVRDLLGW
jgi:hypothetical protein